MSLVLNGVDLEQPPKWWSFTNDWFSVHGWCAAANRAELIEAVTGYAGWIPDVLGPSGRLQLRFDQFSGTPMPTTGVAPLTGNSETVPGVYHYRLVDGPRLFGATDVVIGWGVYADGPNRFTFQFDSHANRGDDPFSDMSPCQTYAHWEAEGSPVAPDEWYAGTEPGADNPSALVDGDPATYGKEDYPSGYGVMYYGAPFTATGMVMEQMPGETSLGVGGFGKNAAAAWHLEVWPAALGAPPASSTNWLTAGAVTVYSVLGYSPAYSSNLLGSPPSSAYKLVMDVAAYTGGDPRSTWAVLEFQLYSGGPLPAGVPQTDADLVRFPVGGTASYSAIEEFSASYDAANAANGYMSTTDNGTNVSWAANGWTTGDWWQVDWSVGQSVSQVILYDRGGAGDLFGTSGRLTFSDSSTVSWSGLTDGGTLTIDFATKTGITWMRVISDAGGTGNAGLVEVEAFA